MRAVIVNQPGGPDQLSIGEVPVPVPGPGEVLIRVAAAGMNRADLMQREGRYPVPAGASPILGLEISGEIVEIGSELEETTWKVGDPVCALLTGGGYAEYALAPAGCCLPAPANFPLADMAALPEAAFTVWSNLFRGPVRLQAGERLLMQGGASGIGSVALQIAKARGIHTATTAGSSEKCAACLSLGAEIAADYHGDWVSAVREWCPNGIDVILDMIAGPYFREHIALLAPRGRLAHIAMTQGPTVELDLMQVLLKNLLITASTLRGRPLAEKTAMCEEIKREVWPLLPSGLLKPIVHARFPLEEVRSAHEMMEAGSHTGKILLLT